MVENNDKDNLGFNPEQPIDMSSILQIQQNNFKTFNNVHQAFISGATTCNEELLQFINKRIKDDLDTFSQFTHCEKPQDIYTVYIKFLQKAVAQYMEEAEKISTIGSKVLSDTMNVIETSANGNEKRLEVSETEETNKKKEKKMETLEPEESDDKKGKEIETRETV